MPLTFSAADYFAMPRTALIDAADGHERRRHAMLGDAARLRG